MQSDYHQRIVQYYRETENAYKDSWDLDKSLAIHYGYWDKAVRDFPSSLIRMNEIMVLAAGINKDSVVLDAGCGVGGSSIYLAKKAKCRVTGITLSERQVQKANEHASREGLERMVEFKVMDYCHTIFPDESFDIVWGCESICYAFNKEEFIREAFRILKPGGQLVVADGFVNEKKNNEAPVIRKWLEGWEVNYLETPDNFTLMMEQAGFIEISCRDISKQTWRSSKRLYRFYWLASLYLIYKRINFSKPATSMQRKNIAACRYQYLGRKKRLWSYNLVVGTKPHP